MITEAVRLVGGWLKHPTHGVNGMLTAIPRKRLSGVDDEAPPPVAVYNDADDESVIHEADPTEVPCVVVFYDGDLAFLADDHKGAGYSVTESAVTLAIAYVTRETPAVRAVQDGNYTMRAVMRSLRRLNHQQYATPAFKNLNGVKIVNVERMTEQRVAGAVGQSQLWGFVLATIRVVDTLP